MHLTAKFFLCVRLMGHPWDQALLPAYGRFPLTGGVLLREVCAHAKCALTGDVHLREVSISDGGSTITEYLSGKISGNRTRLPAEFTNCCRLVFTESWLTFFLSAYSKWHLYPTENQSQSFSSGARGRFSRKYLVFHWHSEIGIFKVLVLIFNRYPGPPKQLCLLVGSWRLYYMHSSFHA